MRIRSTKPEFWRSERIASVTWDARLVLKGLESFVDDNGVGRDDLPLIVGDLFQRDLVREPSRTLARVSEAITELHTAGLVHRYDSDGTALLFLSFWESVQRVDKPQAGRFPRPDGTFNYKDSLIREPDATPRESSRTLAPGTGEQGNRGTEEQGNRETPRKRGTRLNENRVPDNELIAQMRDECPGVDLRAEHRVFVDYWIAQPGQKGVKTDWAATWRNWIRRKAGDTRLGRAAQQSRGQQRQDELLAFATAADHPLDIRQEITS